MGSPVAGGVLLRQLGKGFFVASAVAPGRVMGTGFGPARTAAAWAWRPARFGSSLPAAGEEGEKVEAGRGQPGEEEGKEKVASYWGVSPPKLTKPDGTAWRWRSFMVSRPRPSITVFLLSEGFSKCSKDRTFPLLRTLLSHGRRTSQIRPLIWKSTTSPRPGAISSPSGLSRPSARRPTSSSR